MLVTCVFAPRQRRRPAPSWPPRRSAEPFTVSAPSTTHCMTSLRSPWYEFLECGARSRPARNCNPFTVQGIRYSHPHHHGVGARARGGRTAGNEGPEIGRGEV